MRRKLEKELVEWKNRDEHLPILLRGARQVGKSYLVETFGKDHFEDTAIVNFEERPDFKAIFSTRDHHEVLSRLEIGLGKPIVPGQSLLFLDEIQLCPEALVALRYFKEKMPKLHVIAAGSLLEFLLNDHNFSFPVGRVEFLFLRPLSFEEFLMAAAPILAKRLSEFSLLSLPDDFEHQELLKWFHKYLFIGGMPAAIVAYLRENSLLECQMVHHRILQAYESDFGKYAKETKHKYLRLIFQKAPALVAKVIKYRQIEIEARSRDLKPAMDLLCNAGLFQRVYATRASGLPLHAHIKDEKAKLFYLDVGLLQTATHIDAQLFFNEQVLQVNSGMIAEQFVEQELLAYSPAYQNAPLLYWESETGEGEVDFVLSIGSQIVPIEVKAGTTGSLRSMHSFMKKKNAKLGIRIAQYPLSLNDTILSVPFYLLSQNAIWKEMAIIHE